VINESHSGFFGDLTLAIVVCAGTALYLSRNLRLLLIELCGSTDRANFWLAFSNVSLVVVPLIFALDYRPEFGPEKLAVFEIAAHLKYTLVGLQPLLAGLRSSCFGSFRRRSPGLLLRR